MIDFVLKRSPGSGHWLSWVYLPLNFSNQTITVTWYLMWKGDPKYYFTANKALVVFETLLTYVFWGALLAWVGWKAWILIYIVPLLMTNVIGSSYILVQHLLCPLTDKNDPLENTLGVTTLPFLDRIHFRFSHHVEHHFFPEMNHVELPQLRKLLMADYPNRYRCMSHLRALTLLLTTPRVYQDQATLWDPYSKKVFDVSALGRS